MILPLLTTMALTASPFEGPLEPGTTYRQVADSLRTLKQHVERAALLKGPRHVAMRIEWSGTVADAPGTFVFEVTKKEVRSAATPPRHEYFVTLKGHEPLPPQKIGLGAATFKAVTANAKGGAVLVTSEGGAIYVAGKDSWADAEAPRLVTAKGTLVDRQYLPEAKREEKGLVSQGAEGRQSVLEKPVITFEP